MSALFAHVRAETACLEAFIAALEHEDQALSEGRFEDVAALADRKGSLLADLADIGRAREASLAQLGWPPGRAGADAAARSDPLLETAWTALLGLAGRARDLNRSVGAKVHAHLEFTGSALAFLQARHQPLYGPDGGRVAPTVAGSRLAAG